MTQIQYQYRGINKARLLVQLANRMATPLNTLPI